MLPVMTVSRHWPAPGPECVQSKSLGPPSRHPPVVVELVPPQTVRRPSPDGQTIGLDWVAV
jgi:hypothetical protein